MAKNKTPSHKKPSQKPDDQTDPNDKDQDEDEDDDNDDEGDDAEEQNRRINAIVTSRVKREMKGVLNQLNTLTEAIGKLSTPAKKEETDDEDEDQEQKPAKEDPKIARKMTKLEKELAEEKEARKKAEQAQKDEAEKAKRQEMISHFDSALAEHGISDPILRKAALRHLEDEGKMIRDEETGKPKFKGVDKYGIETNFDPKVGLKTWITTEGKSFVPAVDTGGSGTGGSSVGNTKLTKGEFSKLSPQQKASIELERASMGLPPLEQNQ